jgi:PleD family two-component response regulator
MGQRTQQNVDDPETPWGTCKVLVFDEDIEDLSRQAAPFEARGFEVHKCTSVEAAMRCVEREVFGFALLDQGTPAFRGASGNKPSRSLQLTYALRRGGAPQGYVVLSAGPHSRSDRLFGKTRFQRGDELDYQ